VQTPNFASSSVRQFGYTTRTFMESEWLAVRRFTSVAWQGELERGRSKSRSRSPFPRSFAVLKKSWKSPETRAFDPAYGQSVIESETHAYRGIQA
jgi:hypothetical protein